LDDDDGSLAKAFNEIDADRTDCTLLRINSGVLSDDVIPLCAAYAAQDKGSARQAIKYLRKAAAIAESEGDVRVEEEHVRTAQGEAERELIIEGMEQLTTQGHLALAAVTILELGVTPGFGLVTSMMSIRPFQITLTPTAWLNVGCVIISSSSTC